MFEMTDILTLRSGVDTYGWFVSQFLPAVVGSRCWNANYRKNTISSFVTVSDEAFALVNMENNYARWQDMFIKQNTKTSEVGALCTNSGESKKNGQSKKFQGWAAAGIEQYNAYYLAVKQDRENNREFDVNLLRQFQDGDNNTSQTEVVFSNHGLPGIRPAHDLPWSGVEASVSTTVTTDKDDDGNDGDGDSL